MDSDEEEAKAREHRLIQAINGKVAFMHAFGITSVPKDFRPVEGAEIYRLAKGTSLASHGCDVHLRSMMIDAGYQEGVWMPAKTPTSDRMAEKTPLFLKLFAAPGADGQRKRTSGRSLKEKDGVMFVEDGADTTSAGEVRRNLFMLAMGRGHFMLHIADPSHHGFLLPGEAAGLWNYVLWLAAAEQEIKPELLVKLDSHLMQERRNGRWNFTMPIDRTLLSELSDGESTKKDARSITCWLCGDNHPYKSCPQVTGIKLAPANKTKTITDRTRPAKSSKSGGGNNSNKSKQSPSPKKSPGNPDNICDKYNGERGGGSAGCTRMRCHFQHTCRVCGKACGTATEAPWGRRQCS